MYNLSYLAWHHVYLASKRTHDNATPTSNTSQTGHGLVTVCLIQTILRSSSTRTIFAQKVSH